MQVIATARGYDNVRVREEGEEFDVPEGTTGTWFKPVETAASKPAVKRTAKATATDSGDIA